MPAQQKLNRFVAVRLQLQFKLFFQVVPQAFPGGRELQPAPVDFRYPGSGQVQVVLKLIVQGAEQITGSRVGHQCRDPPRVAPDKCLSTSAFCSSRSSLR